MLKRWVKTRRYKQGNQLTFAVDQTQWRDKNIFIVSLIEDKRGVPVYWQLLPKAGCSNLREQKALISPLLRVFKGYRLLVLGDREFHSVRLAHWLVSKQIDFVLRQSSEFCKLR